MKEYIFKTIDEKLNLKACIYPHTTPNPKGMILYFHGGGFVYGSKYDLPNHHIDIMTKAGYSIMALDYRLAPEASFNLILEDVLDGIEYFIENKDILGFSDVPYFLWGRSAGAYLALLASTYDLTLSPKGIISYYGYGFTVPDWYKTSSIDYLKYPMVTRNQVDNIIKDEFISSGNIQERYPLYLYGRQTGQWISMVFQDCLHSFSTKYVLGTHNIKSTFPPTFIGHSFKDLDVPFLESMELSKLIPDTRVFTCSAEDHDFDRHENSIHSKNLLNQTIEFLDLLSKTKNYY